MGDITKLKVWNSSLDLVTEVYKVTNKGSLSKDFSLRDQIWRSAISVPSNIAEGASSGFDKLGVRYFLNARASCSELKTQIIIAKRINYITITDLDHILKLIDSILKMINSLINYRQSKSRK